MGITFAGEPPNGLETVKEALRRIATDRDWKREVIGNVNLARSQLTEPHPIYTTSLESVRAKNVLPSADAEPIGWRYLVVDLNRRVVASVDLSVDRDGGGLHLSRIWRGPVLDELIAAVGHAGGLFAAGTLDNTTDYELRALELPSVYFMGLWLHGVTDRVVTVTTDVRGLDPVSDYSEDDLAGVLAPIAASRLD